MKINGENKCIGFQDQQYQNCVKFNPKIQTLNMPDITHTSDYLIILCDQLSPLGKLGRSSTLQGKDINDLRKEKRNEGRYENNWRETKRTSF